MEKQKPSYLLATIKEAFSQADVALPASKTALGNAARMGLKAQDIVDCIQSIGSECFYKSMTSDQDPKIWQDVYYVPWGVRVLYVKFTQLEGGKLFLISFKERDR